MAAATYPARGRRDVRVLDTGKPRNRLAAAPHGFPGRTEAIRAGSSPTRAQLSDYPTVELIEAGASAARRLDEGFAVTLDTGEEMTARKLILAFGLHEDGPVGPMIRTDGDKMTVARVYAAGDIARAPHSISWAVADGVTAGISAHRALVFG